MLNCDDRAVLASILRMHLLIMVPALAGWKRLTVDEGLSLVRFLADLRADLALARKHAVEDAVASLAEDKAALWFEVDEAEVTLEVARTGSVSGTVSTEAEGKFLVFASVKAGGEIGGERSRTGTQTLTLTLKPRFDQVVNNEDGTTTIKSTSALIASAGPAGDIFGPR